MMEGNGMFLLLFVFVCQGVLWGQMKLFFVYSDAWWLVGMSCFGGNDGFLGLFGLLLAVRDVLGGGEHGDEQVGGSSCVWDAVTVL